MSDRNEITWSNVAHLAIDLAFTAALYWCVRGLPNLPPSPQPRLLDPSNREVVSLDELSVEMVSELEPNHVAPESDKFRRTTYRSGEQVVCGGHSYYASPLNTTLITYVDEPQYTHVQHACPGKHRQRLLDMDSLAGYLAAGYPVVIRSARAEPGLHRIYGQRTLDQATEEQLTVHQAGLAVDLNWLQANLDGRPASEDTEPVKAARVPTL